MVCNQIIDSYAETNTDGDVQSGALGEKSGQAFANSGAHTLCGAKFYLRYFTDTDFKFKAKLYACAGTPGSDGVGTGAALAESGEHLGSELTTVSQPISFTFGTPYSLVDGTNYVIVVEVTEYTAGALGNAQDWTSPTHGGNIVYDTGAGWQSSATVDGIFYTYEEPTPVKLSTSSNITTCTMLLGV